LEVDARVTSARAVRLLREASSELAGPSAHAHYVRVTKTASVITGVRGSWMAGLDRTSYLASDGSPGGGATPGCGGSGRLRSVRQL
jgi:hypothetical protein